MDFITILKAIILGIVEGLTEFAPVSSTGHMIIVDDMWLKSEEFLTKYGANTFKVVIQLGSILAVVVVMKDRFFDLLRLRRRSKDGVAGQGRLKITHVIVGLIPAGILGVLFENYIDEYLFSTATVLIGLVIGAVLMIIADVFGGKNPKVHTVDQITYKQALIIGLIQCLSLWPGFSRSGATISAGVLAGLSYRAAADFTFLMAVPIMAGASGISLLKNLEYISIDDLPFFIAGFISAFVFALISIKFFLRLIDKIKLVPFAIYRILLALIIYIVYF
ncbi:undecaprenyl-diphosphate phosphatase [Bacillus methanolicus]|uniref:Undecaprenyl-diphosphatase n=1 Tax=Bacillus methanolicus (strain MGA3 / ATCC 53907) TaxID=796606 RepID=I3E3M3_BACMM|nr:undecaprenyl-diphosphate phosphatase [Bacillus methanolicus]AIE58833.1 Undecaprenyl-diphosphatase [Bacillus methanolicus MGA3]EIJ81094.1 undecaprenyl pyrophosphate phosphatase [Bacillus methanolicus MGA3]UQD50927.1 undecaprenyl-diphosphate phosphatase [Bacillus methanolicus]